MQKQIGSIVHRNIEGEGIGSSPILRERKKGESYFPIDAEGYKKLAKFFAERFVELINQKEAEHA